MNTPPKVRPGDIVRCGDIIGRVAWIAQDGTVYINHGWPKRQTGLRPEQLSCDVPLELQSQ